MRRALSLSPSPRALHRLSTYVRHEEHDGNESGRCPTRVRNESQRHGTHRGRVTAERTSSMKMMEGLRSRAKPNRFATSLRERKHTRLRDVTLVDKPPAGAACVALTPRCSPWHRLSQAEIKVNNGSVKLR